MCFAVLSARLSADLIVSALIRACITFFPNAFPIAFSLVESRSAPGWLTLWFPASCEAVAVSALGPQASSGIGVPLPILLPAFTSLADRVVPILKPHHHIRVPGLIPAPSPAENRGFQPMAPRAAYVPHALARPSVLLLM